MPERSDDDGVGNSNAAATKTSRQVNRDDDNMYTSLVSASRSQSEVREADTPNKRGTGPGGASGGGAPTKRATDPIVS